MGRCNGGLERIEGYGSIHNAANGADAPGRGCAFQRIGFLLEFGEYGAAPGKRSHVGGMKFGPQIVMAASLMALPMVGSV